MAEHGLATSRMAVIGRIILTLSLVCCSVTTGALVWFAPLLLRAIPDGDIQLLGIWTVAFLILVMISGGCLIAIWAVWND